MGIGIAPTTINKKTVLEWVNQVRQEYGMPTLAELPQGIRGNTSECVIARALSNGWKAVSGGYQTTLTKETRRFGRLRVQSSIVGHPNFVASFVGDFDTGRYPELVEDPLRVTSGGMS